VVTPVNSKRAPPAEPVVGLDSLVVAVQRFEAAAGRQSQIEQYEIVGVGRERIDGCLKGLDVAHRRRRKGVAPAGGEVVFEQLRVAGVVLDEEQRQFPVSVDTHLSAPGVSQS